MPLTFDLLHDTRDHPGVACVRLGNLGPQLLALERLVEIVLLDDVQVWLIVVLEHVFALRIQEILLLPQVLSVLEHQFEGQNPVLDLFGILLSLVNLLHLWGPKFVFRVKLFLPISKIDWVIDLLEGLILGQVHLLELEILAWLIDAVFELKLNLLSLWNLGFGLDKVDCTLSGTMEL